MPVLGDTFLGRCESPRTITSGLFYHNDNQGTFMTIKQRSHEEILKTLNLPDNSIFLGYVINLPEQDEYLFTELSNDDSVFREYSRSPMLAKIYDDYHEALKSSNDVPKESIVCLLIETEDSFAVAPIED